MNDQIVAVLEKYDSLQKEVGATAVETTQENTKAALVPVSVSAEEEEEEETEGLLRGKNGALRNDDLIKF